MIRITNLNKIYNKGKKNQEHALKDVSLELDSTGLVCILGESGCGKTTLLNTIGGLDTFSGGTIEIDDQKLTKYSPKIMEPIRNDHFDYVFQNYYLLQDYPVAYNVKLALNRYDLTEEEKEERVDYVLEMLGIAKYKKKLVSKLSGGQKQRVSIARALVKSPDVILADEPTGNLDEENTLRIMSILKNISRECLVLLVTHEKRIARFFADRIIEIQDGRIIRDENNAAHSSYTRSDDSNIYLKEMERETLQKDLAQFNIYREKGTIPRKIELTLAWKDDKLYIQNNMPYDILIEGLENGVEILDTERPTLDMADVEQFSYELPKPHGTGKARLSGREILRMALENIRLMGKKQAFVLGIMLVTAVLLSITMAQFVSSVSIDEDDIRATDSHYVMLDFVKDSFGTEDTSLREYIDKNLSDDSHGDIFFAPNGNVYMQGEGFVQFSNLTQLLQDYSYVPKKRLKEEDLVYGAMPVKRAEVVMDELLIERMEAGNGHVSSLHDGPESYLGVRLKIPAVNLELVVTGISNTNEPVIYCSQNVLIGIQGTGYQIGNLDELVAEDPEAKDQKLKDGQVLMREGLYNALQVAKNKKNKVSFRNMEKKFKVVGTFPDDVNMDYALTDADCVRIRNAMIFDKKTCYIYTDDLAATMDYFDNRNARKELTSYKVRTSIPARDEVEAYKEERAVDLDARQLITFAIAIISLIMVYFTIKSNAVSRSEELTVYRLIGISKGSILNAYMLEMFFMTCYTSLPAVLVTSGVIKFVSSIPSLQIYMIFPWWSVLALLLAIYVVHIVISILPVYGILSQPPAALAVKE